MAQLSLESTGNNKASVLAIIWDVYQSLNRHAHSSDIWDECIKRGSLDAETLAGLARSAGIRCVQDCMKLKDPNYGVARCWKTPDGWQQLSLLTDVEMAFDIESDSKQVINDLMEIRKKRDVMLAFHGWAPEIPEIVTK